MQYFDHKVAVSLVWNSRVPLHLYSLVIIGFKCFLYLVICTLNQLANDDKQLFPKVLKTQNDVDDIILGANVVEGAKNYKLNSSNCSEKVVPNSANGHRKLFNLYQKFI